VRLADLLRLTALGVALLCWLDPPSSIAPPPPVIVDAAIVRSSRDSRPARTGDPATVLDAAREAAARLSGALGNAGTVRVHEIETGVPVPCGAVDPCVVLTEGAAPSVPADRRGPVSIVLVGDALDGNVAVTGVSVTPAHVAGQATAIVSIAGQGLQGRTSRVRLHDGSAIVGEATHQWTSDGEVSVNVPWSPVASGTRTLEARVVTDGVEEATLVDNTLSAAAEVTAGRWRVVLHERRPSWAATFIRRAIEGDPRFDVAARTEVAPRVSVTAAGAALDGDRLDEARVVLVGAPDALTTDDVARLEGFLHHRGGAVILAPDRPMTGPVARLIQHRWREQLDDEPSAAGPLRASEWLLAADVVPLDQVWAASDDGPVVVASPLGAGVVVVSGALDAWRHRGTNGAFERFWRSTVAGLAMAVGPPVAVDLVRTTMGTDGEVYAEVRARTVREAEAWEAAATRTCDEGDAVPLRLWPAGAAGSFTARVPVGARTGCRVVVAVAGVGDGSARLVDGAGDASSHRWTRFDAEAIAGRTGGLVVSDGDVSPIVQAWLAARGTERRPQQRHPMRSWWWLLPFVGSLAGEWWLRRRAGLR